MYFFFLCVFKVANEINSAETFSTLLLIKLEATHLNLCTYFILHMKGQLLVEQQSAGFLPQWLEDLLNVMQHLFEHSPDVNFISNTHIWLICEKFLRH